MNYAKKEDEGCKVTGRASYATKEVCEQAMKNMRVNPSYVAYQCKHCQKWHFGSPKTAYQESICETTWNGPEGFCEPQESEIDKAIKLLLDNGYLVLTPDGKKALKQVVSDANDLAKKMRNEK